MSDYSFRFSNTLQLLIGGQAKEYCICQVIFSMFLVLKEFLTTQYFIAISNKKKCCKLQKNYEMLGSMTKYQK